MMADRGDASGAEQSHHLSRRGVIGAAGAGALAASAAPAQARRRGPGRRRLPRTVDVVVVGAGLSGLVAARELVRAGQKVVVLEARDRIGGRLLNHTFPDGTIIETGGAFIGPTQDRIAALAQELGVATFPEYNTGRSVYNSSGLLGRVEFSGTVPPDPAVLPDAAVLLQQINGWAAEIDVHAPYTHPRAKEWDSYTLGDYIRRTAVNKNAVERLIQAWTQPAFGADPDQLSFFFVLHYVACSGNETTKGTFERNSDSLNGAQERRFVGGSELIAQRLAAQVGKRRIVLRTPVKRIVQRKNAAFVRTRRGTVRCRKVILALPPEQALKIAFRPHLPADKAALLRGMPLGELMKCDAVYPTPFWRAKGLNGYSVSDHGPVRITYDNCDPDGQPGVLLGFVGGSMWRQYGLQSREARKAAVLQSFREAFGDEALSPIDYTEKDWNLDRWSGGGPVAIMGPGTLSTYGPALTRVFRRVHWAGTETGGYWNGYMDGAVRAGTRAAAEVLASARPRKRRRSRRGRR